MNGKGKLKLKFEVFRNEWSTKGLQILKVHDLEMYLKLKFQN